MQTVSVIVPVRNEAKAIEPTLRALLAQNYPRDRYEVLVADGGSDDETVPVVRRLQAEFPNLTLLYNPRRLASAGRNVGLRHMVGDVAVIVDGHCVVPTADYLGTLVAAFRASGADSIARPQPLDAPAATPFQKAVAVARQSRLGHNPHSDIFCDEPKMVDPSNTAVAYTRETIRRVGLFDERFDACEDVEFNTRVRAAGLTCYFEPRLAVKYHPRASWPALFRQLARYGCGRARLAAKHPRSLTLPALVPPLWLAWLVAGAFASLLSPTFALVWIATVAAYAAAVLGVSISLGRRQPWPVAVRLPGIFVAIHAGFGWGFLRETGRWIVSFILDSMPKSVYAARRDRLSS